MTGRSSVLFLLLTSLCAACSGGRDETLPRACKGDAECPAGSTCQAGMCEEDQAVTGGDSRLRASATAEGAPVAVEATSEGGTCRDSDCTVLHGAQVTFFAPDAEGYTFTGWSGDPGCEGTEPLLELERVDSDVMCIAHYTDAPDEDAGEPAADLDETAPVLAPNPAAVVLDCGDTFVPIDVTAEDETDGELPVTVEGADDVDTSEPGLYTVTYSAVDAAGNRAELTQAVHVCGPSCGDLGKQAIDLSGWSAVQYEQATQPDANWQLAADALSVQQTVNADASIFFSDFDATDLSVEGSWRMGGSSDDDFVGFVFGYQDRGHYYLFDWKRGTQNYNSEHATAGMSLKIVDAAVDPAALQLVYADLWADEGSENVRPIEVAGIALRNTTPWEFNHDYTFFLEFHAGSFRIDVYDDTGALLQSWSVEDDTYTGGRFGFYNFSQGPVTYESFRSRRTPPECSTVDLPE